MAPAPDDWPYKDVPRDEDAFLADLQAFHEQRGTVLDQDPKVSNRHINLFKLFQLVQERGGYDQVSAEKLAWRKLGGEFSLSQPAYAFQLKTVFYRNLAAYAIKKVHHQEPPPKEILEEQTARGGDLLTRTMENYRTREQTQDVDREGSGDEAQATPKAEKMEIDDPASAGRGGRSLRQAPPQRQFFQPDLSSSRQSRNPSSHTQSPVPPPPLNGVLSTSNPNSANFTVQNFEPSPPVALSLRPVQTPKNSARIFQDRLQKLRDQHKERLRRREHIQRGMLLPGTGFDGPNIYHRTIHALRSGIPEEQAYALHHLVRITDARGDRFRFDAFQGLAEGLIEKTMEVTSLFYDVHWMISYDIKPPKEINVLDGLRGTANLQKRLDNLPRRETPLHLLSKRGAELLNRCNEAALILRNMVQLEANASYLSGMPTSRDLLTIILSLPQVDQLVEMKHYALDMLEQLTSYWIVSGDDPLFRAMIEWIRDGEDRGAVLTSIRAMCRIGYFMPEPVLLPVMSIDIIISFQNWLLLDDDELAQACLEFLYQYTAVPANVLFLLGESVKGDFDIHSLMDQLARFGTHNAKEEIKIRNLGPAAKSHKAETMAELPESLKQELINFPENERSSRWLRSLFEEEEGSAVTQLQLWQAYQNTFAPHCPPAGAHALLAAADFIRNVSATFKGAEAKIEQAKVEGQPPRFIIQGIKYRLVPCDLKARPFSRCLWWKAASEGSAGAVCNAWHMPGEDLYHHILQAHLSVKKSATGTFEPLQANGVSSSADNASIDCHWAKCSHFSRMAASGSGGSGASGHPSALAVARHVLTHFPEAGPNAALRKKHNRTLAANDPMAAYKHSTGISAQADAAAPATQPMGYRSHAFEDTLIDERGQPAVIPYWSVMILRNLARNVPKAVGAAADDSPVITLPAKGPAGGGGSDSKGSGKGGRLVARDWIDRLFVPLEHHIWHVLAYNRTLRNHLFELIGFIEKGRVIRVET